MSYYMAGDYYRGGDAYYQAGGLFGSIGKFLGGVAKVGLGFATGGVGGAVGAATRLFSHPAAQAVAQNQSLALTAAPQPPGPPMSLPPLDQYGIININRMGPGGMGFPTGGALPSLPGAHKRGTHINKHAYETRGGGTSRWGPAGNLQLHPAGTVEVANRHMNVGNARALKKALRRAYGFERLARRVLRITSPRKHVSGFKRSHRRK